MTSAATVAETNLPRPLELFVIEGSNCTEQQKNVANCQEWSTCRNNVQCQGANRAEETTTRSIDCAHFSIQPTGERTPQGSSSPQRTKNAEIRPKPPVEHVSTVDQVAHASRKIHTLYSTGNTQSPEQGLKETRAKAKSRFPSANSATRRHADQEVLPKATTADRRLPSTVCTTTHQDPQPRHHRQSSPRSTWWPSRNHQRGLKPSSISQRFSPVSMFQK